MKRFKITIGGIAVIILTLISQRGEVVFVCLLAALIHELGHLTAARLQKIDVERIELGLMGARIVVDDRLCSYKSELILAASGPLANILAVIISIAVSLTCGVGAEELFESGAELVGQGGGIVGAVGCFVLASIAQAAVNLLPVRSLDGGRMLSAAVSQWLGADIGERAVTVFTAVAVFCLWTVALYLMLRVGSGVGVFTFAACVFFCLLTRGE